MLVSSVVWAGGQNQLNSLHFFVSSSWWNWHTHTHKSPCDYVVVTSQRPGSTTIQLLDTHNSKTWTNIGEQQRTTVFVCETSSGVVSAGDVDVGTTSCWLRCENLIRIIILIRQTMGGQVGASCLAQLCVAMMDNKGIALAVWYPE